jgi:hypothetical protein
MASLLFICFFHPRKRSADTSDVLSKIRCLDLAGFLFFVPGIIMLLLAVQWGGRDYAWNSATIVSLLCGFVVMTVIFILWQWRQQNDASIPPKVFLNRNIYLASLIGFLLSGCVQTTTYYLPMWFQVIKGDSPEQSGINMLPVMLVGGLCTSIAGVLGRSTCVDPLLNIKLSFICQSLRVRSDSRVI